MQEQAMLPMMRTLHWCFKTILTGEIWDISYFMAFQKDVRTVSKNKEKK